MNLPTRRARRPLRAIRTAVIAAASQLWPLAVAAQAGADSAPWPVTPDEASALHGQLTGVAQFHPRYTAAYSGPNSLDPGNNGRETFDATLFAGTRLWRGAQLWADPEIDQGYGLDDTLGAAGFPSGEAYKVGAAQPYYRLPRLFVRQVIGLGGPPLAVPAAANQLAGTEDADQLALTVGKFSVVDVFDANRYAHDPRSDFLNWSIIEAGAFDYAADAWGYTLGAALEWRRARWTVRGGLFDLSRTPNSKALQRGFGQFALIGELEERHAIAGHAGSLKLLGFVNRGRMARYDDALAAAQGSGAAPDPAPVRRFASRPGAALNLEQELRPDLGMFARASLADGSKEAYDFTDIDRSLALGLALRGTRWARADDTVGLAVARNGISAAARRYLAAGGLGILVGDGRLDHYGAERVAELYYAAALGAGVTLTLDGQLLVNPAYNRDRGPVGIFGLRLHAEY